MGCAVRSSVTTVVRPVYARSLVVTARTPCSWGLVRAHNAHSESIANGAASAQLATGLGPPGEGAAPSSKPSWARANSFSKRGLPSTSRSYRYPLFWCTCALDRERCPPPIGAVMPLCCRPCRDMPVPLPSKILAPHKLPTKVHWFPYGVCSFCWPDVGQRGA